MLGKGDSFVTCARKTQKESDVSVIPVQKKNNPYFCHSLIRPVHEQFKFSRKNSHFQHAGKCCFGGN